jgi:aryl-alcohol dehydrogenase-like predicted oxidoreductase
MTSVPVRRLGGTDLEVSVVGLGCNNFGRRIDRDRTRAVIDAALDGGISFFDTADIYGSPHGASEELIGEFLGDRRERVVLATKFGMDMEDGKGPGGSRAYVLAAADASLRRLRTDVIDLHQYHEPDGVTPIEETLGALDELVRAGKVRHIGCSNFSAEQVEEADRVARERGLARFISVQNEYSLLHREPEPEVTGACERLGLSLIPYYPLASGLLTGKYRRGQPAPAGTRLAQRPATGTDEQFDVVERLERFAVERGVTLLAVAIGWLLSQPTVDSVIAGATRPEQVRANVAAALWTPTPEELEELDRITAG